jgi:hypothetical protein
MRRSIAALIVLLIVGSASPAPAQEFIDDVGVYADGFDFLTNLAIAPDGTMFVTEKELGEVLIVRDGRALEQPFATFDVIPDAERGLLGIALHPEFPDEPWVYIYYSDARSERNRVVRVRADGDRGGEVDPLLELLPATSGYHNGGDLAFGTDGMLYVVTGEAHNPERAQAADDLGGKILRVTPEGTVPEDNPFGPGSPVYSMGHRNSFGLCVDPSNGQVWETENGPSEHDEVNRIVAGENYGWPQVSGPGGGDRYVDPVIDYPNVIVPTGCAVAGPRLIWADFGIGSIHHAEIQGSGLGEETRVDVGRLMSDVVFDPADGLLYIAAGNSILNVQVRQPASPSPATPTASPEATPDATPTPAGEEDGRNTLSVIVIAVLLALGIIAMRGRIRPPSEPPDPTRV